MKGKKMVIALLLSLIVCLVIIPTCAFADSDVPAAGSDQTTPAEPAPAATDTGTPTGDDGGTPGGTGTTPGADAATTGNTDGTQTPPRPTRIRQS